MPGARLLSLDASYASVLVSCRACPGFQAIASTKAEARALADAHRASVHPRQAARTLSARRVRARTTGSVGGS